MTAPQRPQDRPPYDVDPRYVAEPEPVRRQPREADERWLGDGGRDLALVILATAVIAAIVLFATSRSAQTTDPAPSRDVSASAEISSAGLTGSPRSGELSVSPDVPDTTRRRTSGSIPAPARGVPPSPAPASGAGSEGAHPPTTSTPATTRTGIASHVGEQFGRRYLALPEHRWGHPGIQVRICGAGGCVTRTSTDAGPDKAMQRAGRVADLNAWDFRIVCGVAEDEPDPGLCAVSVEYLGKAVRLPDTATDVAP